MELSPEERKRIYEEEKARIEARDQVEKEKYGPSSGTTINLTPQITGVLCYLGIWVTGIIFLILEQKNKWVRFHAAQSIVVFGGLGIAMAMLHWIPFFGWFFTAVIWIIGIIMWVVLMSKAYNGELYKVPLAGDLAEMLAGISINPPNPSEPPPPSSREEPIVMTPPPPPPPPPAMNKAGFVDVYKAPPQPPSPPPPPAASREEPREYYAPPPPLHAEHGENFRRRADSFFFRHRKEGRITRAAFAIAWSIVLLVAFSFLNQYIAYYTYHTADKTWTWQSFFTNDIGIWLPILNAALVIAIVGNIALIIVNNGIVREAIHVITNGFGLASVITLLVVYPFNFSVIPNSDAAGWTDIGVRIFLTLVAVGIGISLLVGIIKLLINVMKTVTRATE